MATPYTATSNIESIKLKAWTSSSSSLTDPQLLSLLEDSLRSYVVPFTKTVRDEWFVSGFDLVTTNSEGIIPMPNSIASTIRTIAWANNGNYIPLDRIEPENAFAFVNSGGGQPVGYMIAGYQLQILPPDVGSVQIFLSFMERPATMVLEQDAGRVTSSHFADLTLASVPLAWQSSTPTQVDIISGESPFSAVQTVGVTSLVGTVLSIDTLSQPIIDALQAGGVWVSDVGTSPFPNIPIEFAPLLQQDVVCTLFQGLGDKRLQGAMLKQAKLEKDIKATMKPRTQGSARPLVNKSAPGMRGGRWGGR